jgi:hypothetical protein
MVVHLNMYLDANSATNPMTALEAASRSFKSINRGSTNSLAESSDALSNTTR